MSILVTVGTTNFDSLIEFLDNNFDEHEDVLFQIANGEYKPKQFEFIAFTKDIDALYKKYDFIITHAGAGTIYKLLDLRKKFIVVPNLERIDSHQTDIAQFVEENNYALTCINYEDIPLALKKLPTVTFEKYEKEPFVKAEEICNSLREWFK